MPVGYDLCVDHGIFLAIVGFITGLIDSIAGGGGLISVPAFMLVLGPGAEAVGTNKVVAFCSTITALYIYYRKGFVDFRANTLFFICVLAGACIGAYFSRFLNKEAYQFLMLILIPLILWVLFQRDLWKERVRERKPASVLAMLGFACGFYDGIAGPGGGTLMFLSLFILGGFPLTAAIGSAKLANVCSASSSLVTYIAMGKVHWEVAWPMTITIVIGAVIGATFATKNAAFYARLALAAVSIIILGRLVLEQYR